jgi:hypothetical protein
MAETFPQRVKSEEGICLWMGKPNSKKSIKVKSSPIERPLPTNQESWKF